MICAIYKNSIIVITGGCFEIASRFIYIALTYIIYDINSSIVQLCSYIFNLYSLVSVLFGQSRHLVMISISVGIFSVMFSRLFTFAKIKFLTTVDVDSPDHTASHDEVT